MFSLQRRPHKFFIKLTHNTLIHNTEKHNMQTGYNLGSKSFTIPELCPFWTWKIMQNLSCGICVLLLFLETSNQTFMKFVIRVHVSIFTFISHQLHVYQIYLCIITTCFLMLDWSHFPPEPSILAYWNLNQYSWYHAINWMCFYTKGSSSKVYI